MDKGRWCSMHVLVRFQVIGEQVGRSPKCFTTTAGLHVLNILWIKMPPADSALAPSLVADMRNLISFGMNIMETMFTSR